MDKNNGVFDVSDERYRQSLTKNKKTAADEIFEMFDHLDCVATIVRKDR